MGNMEVRRASTASSRSAPTGASSRVPKTAAVRWAVFIAPALLLYAIFVLLPAIQVGWLALQRWNGYGPQHFVGLQNFAILGGDQAFLDALKHSLFWEVGAAALIVVGLLVALLARRARGGDAGLAILFFPVLLPQIVVAAIWILVYSPLTGLVNTVLGDVGLGQFAGAWLGDPRLAPDAIFVAWAWSAVGVSAVILRVGLAAIGREYMEIALTEGAGPLWIVRNVTIPGVRHWVAIAVLVNLALAGQVFDLIYVTTGGGPGDATMTLPLDMYGRAFGGRTGEGAAVALVQVFAGVAIAVLALILARLDAGMNTGEREHSPTGSHDVASSATMTVISLFVLLPLLWLVGVAVGLAGTTIGPSATLDPRTWQLGSFGDVWAAGMAGAVGASLELAVAITLSTLVLAVPAAFAISQLRSRVIRVALALVLVIGLFQPTSILIIPLFSLLNDFGLLNSVWGVFLPEVARATPVTVMLTWAWFAGLPREIMDAGAVDGAGPTRQFVSLALPLALPAIFVAAVWAFLTSWNEYLLPTVVSQDGSLTTVPTLLGVFVGKADTAYAALAAGCLMALAPILVLYAVLRRSARVFASSRKGTQ